MEKVRRVIWISFFLLAFIFTILSIGHVSAQESEVSPLNSSNLTDGTGLWNWINGKYLGVSKYISAKTDFALGFTDAQGNSVGDFGFIGLIVLGVIIVFGALYLLSRRGKKSQIFDLVVYILIIATSITFVPVFLYLFFKTSGVFTNFLFSITCAIWILLFSEIHVLSSLSKSDREAVLWQTSGLGHIRDIIQYSFKRYWWMFVILAFIPLLFGVPLLNRILQVATLQFTELGWFFRSLIVASIIFFFPIGRKRYLEYRKRVMYYRYKLRERAQEEIMKLQTPVK